MAVGLWLVGGRGSVATTVGVGVSAVTAGAVPTTGLVTELDALGAAGLPPVGDLVIGGHDVVDVPLRRRADRLAAAGALAPGIVAAAGDQLDLIDGRIRPGIGGRPGETCGEAVARARADLEAFRAAHDADPVVVINVATTEAAAAPAPAHAELGELRRALARGDDVLPPSAAYACAAFDAGCAFVDFTPSTGARLPALRELALANGCAHAGRDGKTGETLLRAALAPMFAERNLRVRSWVGTNLLGGGDGASLAADGPREAKLATKAAALRSLLPHEPHVATHIHYVEDLGDWKTAWDHVAFEGFLGTPMRLQLTWQGCDSALAAPLVIDLARLVAAAQRRGAAGPLPALAFFFKDPEGTTEHRLGCQFRRLRHWAETLVPGARGYPWA